MTWLTGVLAALALLTLGACVFGILAWTRAARLEAGLAALRDEQQRQTTSLLALHGAMKAIAEDVIGHGQLQSSLQRTLERLSTQQSELRLRDADEGAYAQAIQLIEQGRGREEVRKLCALTPTELDLLFNLHVQGTGAPVRRAARVPDPR